MVRYWVLDKERDYCDFVSFWSVNIGEEGAPPTPAWEGAFMVVVVGGRHGLTCEEEEKIKSKRSCKIKSRNSKQKKACKESGIER